MGSLIVKDFASCWKQLGIMLLMYVGFSMMDNIPADTYLIMAVFLFAMQTAYLEEKNNMLMMLKTLPLSIHTVVWSKYLATFLAGLLFCAIGVLDLLILRPKGLGVVLDLIFGELIMLNVMGIFLMIFYRNGYSRASQISIVLFLIIFMTMMLPRYSTTLMEYLQPVMDILQTCSQSAAGMILTGACLLGTYYLMSLGAIHFFRRRETY